MRQNERRSGHPKRISERGRLLCCRAEGSLMELILLLVVAVPALAWLFHLWVIR